MLRADAAAEISTSDLDRAPIEGRDALTRVRPLAILFRCLTAILWACAVCMAAKTALSMLSFRDVSYPDSATLLRIEDFVHSGRLYPPLDRPPYLVTLYGPLTYFLLGVPYWVAETIGVIPAIAVRAGVVIAVSACFFLLFKISKRLYGQSSMALLCLPLVGSLLPLSSWTTQIRGDFLGIAFSLTSIYVFLGAKTARTVILAVVCASLAMLVKQTMIAAALTIILSLAVRRRYQDAAIAVVVTLLCVFGTNALLFWREPLMGSHLSALRVPLFEYPGILRIGYRVALQALLPLGLLGAGLAIQQRRAEGASPLNVFVLYCAVAFAISIASVPQIGGNVNYFWEPLFASAVLAAAGLDAIRRAGGGGRLIIGCAAIILSARSLYSCGRDLKWISQTVLADHARRAEWRAFSSAIAHHTLLSTLPDVTAESSSPQVPDPYLNSVLALAGRWSYRPIIAAIEAGEYQLVVTAKGESELSQQYRGVPYWSAEVWHAVRHSYQSVCTIQEFQIWLPRLSAIPNELAGIGCKAEKGGKVSDSITAPSGLRTRPTPAPDASEQRSPR